MVDDSGARKPFQRGRPGDGSRPPVLRSLAAAIGVLHVATACAADPPSPSAAREGYVDGAAGARLFYRIDGSGTDTVVVVHGGPGAGMNAVRPDFGPLAEERVVLYYDQRGGGRSTLPSDTTLLGPEHHVGDLEAVRRHFGLRRMDVVAHSFGAILVAEYARHHPERLDRVVFLGATGPRRRAMGELMQARSARADTALARRLSETLSELLEGTAEDPVAACEAYHARGAELAADLGLLGSRGRGSECLMQPEALRYYFRYTAQLGPALFGAWDYTTGLDSLAAPLLVVHGADDPAELAIQREWLDAFPHARLLAVPEAGKGVAVDRPEVVFAAIDEFLDGGWPEEAATR